MHNNDLAGKVSNSTRVSNSILDIIDSDFTLQGYINNSQRELFAITAYDTDSFKYLHSTNNGTTWTTVWEISPNALTMQVSTNTTHINTVVNIGVISADTNNFVDQGYSYAKALNNGHLVNVSLIYRITASGSDVTIARLGSNYPTFVAFGSCCINYDGGDYGAYPVYIDTNGYIHIQLDSYRTYSNNLLVLNMSYLR